MPVVDGKEIDQTGTPGCLADARQPLRPVMVLSALDLPALGTAGKRHLRTLVGGRCVVFWALRRKLAWRRTSASKIDLTAGSWYIRRR